MDGFYHHPYSSNSNDANAAEQFEEMISFLRSRLNIIGTSVYLIQAKLANDEKDVGKYFKKINEQIESIRAILNK
jgi:hypothetical protein